MVVCRICKKEIETFNPKYCSLHISKRTMKLVASHNVCIYERLMLNIEYKDFKKKLNT